MPQPRFIKLNSCSNNKQPFIEALFSEDLPSEMCLYQIQPICSHCQKWLRSQIRIKTEHEHYCVGCFSIVLPECETYQVLSHDSFELIGDGWPARDQLLLLTAIQKFGFGNWNEIQEFMSKFGSNFFKDQIQLHYDKFYGKSSSPKLNPFVEFDKTKVNNPSRKVRSQQVRTGKSIQKSTAYSLFHSNQMQQQSIPCYNSKRGEFNIEYKENLEKYIADLEFRENDSQKEIELKYKILETYNLGLEDRHKKHHFILEHKLLDENYQAEQNKIFQINPYANKAHSLLIELMRTMTHQEYLDLRKSIEFCLKIQTIIDSLRAIRSSNVFCSIETIARLNKSLDDSVQELGKPRKKVHKSGNSAREEQEKSILKKLNVGKQDLRAAIEKARHQNQTVIYKDIKITPINNLIE